MNRQGTLDEAYRPFDSNCLDIGLVNNMPDSALEATERQFRSLLEDASDGLIVRLRLYSLPGVPRGEFGRSFLCDHSQTDAPADTLDGLIVTGTEPQARCLTDEPYWNSMTRLLEWADRNTASTIWSCLASHAAVLYTDGIQRSEFAEKKFGIFDGSCVTRHRLNDNAGIQTRMPHSRWNDLPEEALQSCGYQILSRSSAGIDAFVRQRRSLFVFFQGHPEYEAETLLLEYRRDIKRFLRGERDTYPQAPEGYLDGPTTAIWNALKARALSDRREEIIREFPLSGGGEAVNSWRADAVRIYRNWLGFLSECKIEKRTSELLPVTAD